MGVHLPVQGTQVCSLVWEDSTCRRATTEAPAPRAHAPTKRRHGDEEPIYHNKDPV